MISKETISEKLAGRKVVCSISGGKDSAATSLYLTELGIEHFRIFADTGWESRWTYEYIRGPLTKALGPITEIRGPRSFEELVKHKAIFPDRTKRFCTEELKIKPITAWIGRLKEELDEDVVNAIGVRREESAARSAALEWEYSQQLDLDVWRPIVDWTVEQVVAIHRRHGLEPNPLYLKGAKRVGCWPCIHASQEDIALIKRIDPARIERVRELEEEVNFIAEQKYREKGEEKRRLRTMFSVREGKPRPDGKGGMRRHHLPMMIDEAVEWARKGRLRRGWNEDQPASCGAWGFCDGSPDADSQRKDAS